MIEFTIHHNGTEWVINNNDLTLSAPTIEQLDNKLKSTLREKKLINKDKKQEVVMRYDNSTIPEWIRQYSQHYFNRVIEV